MVRVPRSLTPHMAVLAGWGVGDHMITSIVARQALSSEPHGDSALITHVLDPVLHPENFAF